MIRLLAVLLDASDVFNDFMILQDSYMEPTRVGSDGGGSTMLLVSEDCFSSTV